MSLDLPLFEGYFQSNDTLLQIAKQPLCQKKYCKNYYLDQKISDLRR